jgi:hypothetical protein
MAQVGAHNLELPVMGFELSTPVADSDYVIEAETGDTEFQRRAKPNKLRVPTQSPSVEKPTQKKDRKVPQSDLGKKDPEDYEVINLQGLETTPQRGERLGDVSGDNFGFGSPENVQVLNQSQESP